MYKIDYAFTQNEGRTSVDGKAQWPHLLRVNVCGEKAFDLGMSLLRQSRYADGSNKGIGTFVELTFSGTMSDIEVLEAPHGWVAYNSGPGEWFWNEDRSKLEHELTDEIRPATHLEKYFMNRQANRTHNDVDRPPTLKRETLAIMIEYAKANPPKEYTAATEAFDGEGQHSKVILPGGFLISYGFGSGGVVAIGPDYEIVTPKMGS